MGDNIPTSELFGRYVIPTYGRFNLELSRGSGSWVWDEEGRRYLDFGAGIAVTSVGHCHPRVTAKMQEQLGVLVHTSNLYYTRPQGLLARRLVEIMGGNGKVFFCNSGAEANEALYKLARKFGNEASGFDNGKPARIDRSEGRHTIFTMRGSFHGRTLGGISATGQDKVKKGFEPMVQGFQSCTFNDTADLERSFDQSEGSVAILLEPVQGESGIHPATPAFLNKARELCEKKSALLMYDEVQCGLGRTGTWNGFEAIDPEARPDAISWAKGIAGGFPLGAIWVSDRPVQMRTGEVKPLCDLLGPGTHGTTFGGTPLVCTGALEVLAVVEEEHLLENSRQMGAYAIEAIRALRSHLVKAVRGVGLMIGIELGEEFANRHILPPGKAPAIFLVERLHEAGLLTVPSGTHTIRWLPPLNVSQAEVDEAVAILGRILSA